MSSTGQADRCGYCGLTKRPEDGGHQLSPSKGCRCPNACDSTDSSIRLGCVPESAFRRSPSVAVPPAAGGGAAPALAATNLGIVEIVSVREKHGWFRKAIPCMPMPLAVLLCLVNVLLPGVGTLLSLVAVAGGCPTDYGSRRRSCLVSLLAGSLQLLTAPIIVGWIWSILWGITFVQISAAKDDNQPTSTL